MKLRFDDDGGRRSAYLVDGWAFARNSSLVSVENFGNGEPTPWGTDREDYSWLQCEKDRGTA